MRLRNWKLKATVQRAFSATPGGHHLNYALQRAIGGLPYPDDMMRSFVATGAEQVDALAAHGIDVASARSFEFGAGFDLHMPLIRAGLGLGSQLVVDIRALARPDLVAVTFDRLKVLTEGDGRFTWPDLDAGAGSTDILSALHIEYRAPSDARSVDEPDGSFDAVLTTDTLEHIPADDLASILTESLRLLRSDGMIGCHVDYSDHWSHFDRSITPLNFLTFDEATWNRWNPSLMWQNRLRHSDYVALFEQSGFEVVAADPVSTAESRAALEHVVLAPPFDQHTPDDVAAQRSFIVARRP